MAFFCLNAFSQQSNSNRIEWSEDLCLEWTDFKGKPDYRLQRIGAITTSIIQYKYHCENGYLQFSAKAIFQCDESWVKPESMDNQTLEHERLHFDITEAYTRILLDEVKSRQWKCNEVAELEKVIKWVMGDWREFQAKYDHQTWYSQNTPKQKQWNETIRTMLHL